MKEYIRKINEMRKDPKGRAILFFGFYFLFFLAIFILARVGGSNSGYYTEYETKPYSFQSNQLLANNYSYHYIITVDQVVYDFVGKKNGDKELFTLQDKEYYHEGDNYFVKDELWIKSENPYLYTDFLDAHTILSLIEASFYESTISYESGKHTFNFLLSTNTINQKLYNLNSDFSEEPNRIVVSTDEEKRVNQIVFQLDSYCMLNQYCTNGLKIELQYDNFGEIEYIKNPMID